jgi:hypothetical protein
MSRGDVIDILAAVGIIAIVGGVAGVVAYAILPRNTSLNQQHIISNNQNQISSEQTNTTINNSSTGMIIGGNVSGNCIQNNNHTVETRFQ